MAIRKISKELNVPEYEKDEFVELHLTDCMSEKGVKDLEDKIYDIFMNEGKKKFLLNMEKVININSRFLAAIFRSTALLRPAYGRIIFYNALPSVYDLFHTTGTQYICRVYKEHERAEAELYLTMPIPVLKDLAVQVGYDENKFDSLLEVSGKVIEKLVKDKK